jgi:sensor histidine kinase YesM
MYPLTIYDLYDKVIAMQPQSAAQFESSRYSLLILLTVIQLAFLGIVFVLSIFMSHKIAGPMYKLMNFLRDIRNGGEIRPIFFRDGDNFHEVADEVNLLMDHLMSQREEDFAYLEEVSTYINNLALVVPEDKKPVLQEILSRLATIQNRYHS